MRGTGEKIKGGEVSQGAKPGMRPLDENLDSLLCGGFSLPDTRLMFFS